MKIKLKKAIVEAIKIENLKPFGVDSDSMDYDSKVSINLSLYSLEKIQELKDL